MQILKKIRDTFFALLPIMVIVLFVHFFISPIDTSLLVSFFIAAALICVGESFFLTGVDSTIMPMGDLMISAVNKASKFIVFIIFAVIFGFFATIAEPDVSVFSTQVITSGVNISKNLLIFFIGFGVGLFIFVGIIRIIKNINIKILYLVLFAIIFLLCTGVKSEHIAIAFDAGGSTTGIVTAPFLLAIASGVSEKTSKTKTKEVFGMVGLASLGPIIAVLLYFVCFSGGRADVAANSETVNIFVETLKRTALGIIPLTLVFFVYEVIFIKLPHKKKIGLIFGIITTFVGLYLFLLGIELGIEKMGSAIGKILSGQSLAVSIILSIAIGFVITFSEPSVIVLAKQVETATKRNIPYVVVIISIAISMALAMVLTVLKIVYSINFFYIIMIGYLIALILMFIVPPIFTGLAFDSGGVASGPMTSAFILPIMLALASNFSSAVEGFGLIGIVGMCPIVVLQVLGLVYKLEIAYKNRMEQKSLIRIAYTSDMYSNIEKLEEEYKKLNKGATHER